MEHDDGNIEVSFCNYKHLESKITKAFNGINSTHKLELTKIEKAHLKMSGDVIYTIEAAVTLNDRAAKCSIIMREQPWKRYKQFELTCDDGCKTLILKCQNVRQTSDDDDLPPNTAEVGQKLHEFLTEIADRNSDRFCLMDIDAIETQSDTDITYKIAARVMRPDLSIFPCEFQIYESAHRETSEIKMNCSNVQIENIDKV